MNALIGITIKLRPLEREDLRFVHQLNNNDSIMRYWFEEAYESFAELQQLYERNIHNQTERRFIIANSDTVMSRSNVSLMAEIFPGVPHKGQLSPNGTLLSIDKARRLLDYNPQHSWRNHV